MIIGHVIIYCFSMPFKRRKNIVPILTGYRVLPGYRKIDIKINALKKNTRKYFISDTRRYYMK